MPAQDATRFRWVDTPDPRRVGFSIAMPDATLSDVDINAFIPGVTLYSEMPKVIRAERLRPSLQGYRYAMSQQAGNATRVFYFFPPMTDEERNTPFREYKTTLAFTWPTVLEKLVFAEDSSLMQLSKRNGVNVEIPSIIPQILLRDAYSEDAIATVRLFLSDTPYPEYLLRHETPVPTSVYWTFQGQQVGEFRECLHPEVNPNLDLYAQFMQPIYGAGTDNGIGEGFTFDHRIPATNFTDWEDHIIQDRVSVTEMNLYLREQVEVHVPDFRPPPLWR